MFHKKTVARKDNNKRSRRTIERKRTILCIVLKRKNIRRVLNLLDRFSDYILCI